MIAIGNGEPCPFCKPKKDKVFISTKDNDFMTHILDKHREVIDTHLFGDKNIGL